MNLDRDVINALVIAAVAWYFTRDPMPALAVGGASFALAKI